MSRPRVPGPFLVNPEHDDDFGVMSVDHVAERLTDQFAGVTGYVYPANNTSAAMAAAVASIGSGTGTVCLRSGTWPVDTAITVPTGVTLRIEAGAVLVKSGSGSIVINGPFEAPAGQVFSGFNSGVSFGPGHVVDLFPQWWGAKGDGETDSTAAIQASIDTAWACDKITRLLPGDYLISSLIVPGIKINAHDYLPAKAFRFIGSGREQTRLICTQTAVDCITNDSNTGFDNPHYEMADFTLVGPDAVSPRTTTSKNGIRLIGGAAVPILKVSEITVSNFYGGIGFQAEGDFEDGTVQSLRVLRCHTGASLGPVFNQNVVTNIQADANAENGLVLGCTSCAFVGGLVQSNEKHGLVINGGINCVFMTFHFENNNSSGATDAYAVEMRAGAGHPIQHMQFYACTFFNTNDKIYMEGEAGYGTYATKIIGGYGQAIASPKIICGNDYVGETKIVDFCFDSEISMHGTRYRVDAQTKLNYIKCAAYYSDDGSAGASATFTSADGKTVTIKNGLVTNVA